MKIGKYEIEPKYGILNTTGLLIGMILLLALLSNLIDTHFYNSSCLVKVVLELWSIWYVIFGFAQFFKIKVKK